MGRRVFICSNQNFPRGSAGANYIQYFGLALIEVGFEVIVLSASGNYSNCNEVDGRYFYKGLELIIPDKRNKKGVRYLEAHYIGWRSYEKEIDKFKPTKEDMLVFYLTNPFFIKGLRNYAKKKEMKTAACIVEYFAATEFERGEQDKEYKWYKRAVDIEIPECDVLFPISTYIADIYKQKGKKTIVIPIMADVNEFNQKFEKKFGKKIKIIYPANGMMKDSIEKMLLSLSELDEQLLGKIEFHITSFNNGKTKIESIISGLSDKRKRNLMSKNIIYHDWLKYDELIELYRQMNFLLLARECNQMTMANFPSKIPETMAFGIIPIASEVGDYTKYYLKDGQNSIVFKGGDIDSCKKAIQRAIKLEQDKIYQLSYNAYLTAKKEFDYHNWIKTIGDAIL